MTQKEKLDKMRKDFSSLNGEQQDYILGILQALVFVANELGTHQPVEAANNNNEGVSV
jgi:hypothetical protein